MKLYYLKGACSLATHIALVWACTPYELALLDHGELHGPDVLALNPKGAVPILVLRDGGIVTESLATLQLVADLHPEANLGAPAADPLARARLNEALADLVSEVHTGYGAIFTPARHITDPAHEGEAKAAAYKVLDQHFARLETMFSDGRDWMVFGRRTVADAYLYVMCRWKNKTPKPLSDYPALLRHSERLEADAGVLRALHEERDEPLGSNGAASP